MIEFKLSKHIPPIYFKLKKSFGVQFKDIIIAYDDTIYCADDLPNHSIAHELIHLDQQERYGVEKWWNEYLVSVKFRLSQEIPAYQAEIRYLKNHPEETTLEYREQWIEYCARCLSGPMYGNIISYKLAVRLLK